MANPSNIFKSSSELANSVYKQTRNRYSQFKIGILSCLVMIAGIIYDAYNQYLWIEFGCDTINIAIHVAVFLIFVTVIVLSVFYMLSGGKKDLLGKEMQGIINIDMSQFGFDIGEDELGGGLLRTINTL